MLSYSWEVCGGAHILSATIFLLLPICIPTCYTINVVFIFLNLSYSMVLLSTRLT